MKFKATPLQYLFAQPCVITLLFYIPALIVAATIGLQKYPYSSTKEMMITVGVGAFIGLISSYIISCIVWKWRIGANGSFRRDLPVLILRGRHKNQTAKVYEIWFKKCQVRLDLGVAEKKSFDDVFLYTEICSLPDNPTAEPGGSGIPYMRRSIFITLWTFGFYFIFSLIGGAVIGIIIGFTDFDVEKDANLLVGIVNVFLIVGLAIGLLLGIKEKLPGTKRSEPQEAEQGVGDNATSSHEN